MWVYVLILHQNSVSGPILKVNCNVKSKITSINFMLHWNPWVCTWMDPLLIQDFVTSCTDHLKNISWLSYADLLNINTFYGTKSKQSYLVRSPNWQERPLNTGKLSSLERPRQLFQILIFISKLWFSFTDNK